MSQGWLKEGRYVLSLGCSGYPEGRHLCLHSRLEIWTLVSQIALEQACRTFLATAGGVISLFQKSHGRPMNKQHYWSDSIFDPLYEPYLVGDCDPTDESELLGR